MSGNLKSDLLGLFPTTNHGGLHGLSMPAELWAALRDRLARATVMELSPCSCGWGGAYSPTDKYCAGCGRGLTVVALHTEAELRDRLAALLPGWCVIQQTNPCRCWVCDANARTAGAVTYAALRKPGGPERVAQALKVLAGEDVK